MMILTTRRGALTAGVFATGLFLAVSACGSSGSSGSSGSAASTASSPGGSAATSVHTANDATLGSIVVDGTGRTLYRFDMDSASPSASHCTGGCAALWPAAPATAAGTVTGVDGKLVGSVTGADGKAQLTLAGWPLYTYAADAKAGDTHGQGVQGIWWAVTPTGAKAAAMSTAPSSGSNGY
jgi:predicted lipoprotein with Yx(FWY)xxD motif